MKKKNEIKPVLTLESQVGFPPEEFARYFNDISHFTRVTETSIRFYTENLPLKELRSFFSHDALPLPTRSTLV